jgi:four helix bundle protein
MAIKSYKDLVVWQKSMDFVTRMYELTATFPRDQIYGLSSQMQRASVSIPSNIAEGYYRKSTKDYIRFLRHSFASGAELETQLMISRNLNFITEEKFNEEVKYLTAIMKMLNKLISTINTNA